MCVYHLIKNNKKNTPQNRADYQGKKIKMWIPAVETPASMRNCLHGWGYQVNGESSNQGASAKGRQN